MGVEIGDRGHIFLYKNIHDGRTEETRPRDTTGGRERHVKEMDVYKIIKTCHQNLWKYVPKITTRC